MLRSNLEGLTLTAYPGENVGLFCHDAAKIVREITMNFTKKDEIPDLTTSALKGLTYASDLLLCAKVRELRIANDVSGFTGAFGGTPVDAITALQEIEDLYDVLVAQSDYAPARPAPTSRAGVSMQGQALQQDRTSTTGSGGPSKPSNDSEITCWSCKQIGHRAGSDKCANYIGADKWTTTDKEAIKELISTKKASLPDRAHIPDSAEHSITYNNNVVAKYCRHCGRFVIGNNAHFTPGHRGGYKFAYKPTAAAPAAAPAAAAPAAPTPAIPAIPAAPRQHPSQQIWDLSPLPALHLEFLRSPPINLPPAQQTTGLDQSPSPTTATSLTSSPGWGKIKADRMLHCSHPIDRPIYTILLLLPNLRFLHRFLPTTIKLHLWYGGNVIYNCKRRDYHFIPLLLYYQQSISPGPMAIRVTIHPKS